MSQAPVPKSFVVALLWLVCLAGVTGCPRASRRTLVPSVPTSGDAAARSRFLEAKNDFERDGQADAAEFEAIAESYPEDPIAPFALLYAGMSAIRAREYDKAVTSLTALDEEPDLDKGMRVRGRLFLGIALGYQGKHDQALPHLRAGEPALETDAERGEWLAAMAEALGRSAEPLDALIYYDRWYQVASESEKAFVVARLGAVVGQASVRAARAAYDSLERRDSPGAAILGLRVAADWAAEGSPDNAQRVRKQTEAGRQALGLLDQGGSGEGGDPGQVGAILPLTGELARRGELVLRGLALASGTFDQARGADMQPFVVSVRDTASTAQSVGAAVDASAAEGVIALIGPIDGGSVDAAAAHAHGRGVPLLSLNPRSDRRAGEHSRFVFHVLQSAEDRARALARHAHNNGVRSYAILRPDNGYGRAVSDAFRDEVTRLGGKIAESATYDPKATSFGDAVKKLGGEWQAVFIPDQASRLELIAPALAAADLMARPIGEKERRKQTGRSIVLLSTAEFIAPRYLRSAGRYSLGAVLAPGFFPDREDALIRDFVDRYELAFGAQPTALDAYAYDAALAVRKAVAEGARTRAGLADALAAMRVKGLTGTIAFDDKHHRADDGLLYTVVSQGEVYAIRAMRD